MMIMMMILIIILTIIITTTTTTTTRTTDQGTTPGSLWLMDYFFYFPMCVYLGFEFYNWCEGDYKIEVLDKDGDGDVR